MSDHKIIASAEQKSSRYPSEHDVIQVSIRANGSRLGKYYFEDRFQGDIYTYVGFEFVGSRSITMQYTENSLLPVAIKKLIGTEQVSKVVDEDGDVVSELDFPGVENDE